FKKLYTVDSIELNGFHAVQKLIKDYVFAEKATTPLCLGVFGPPGSGKSFGIKQISKGIMGDNVPILTFNLSQFPKKEMLIGAFHQVRDEVLKGKVPVVFWDEFDCDQLSWLQYMLAPMNDGEFLEGQVTHPIGKCIFIFAGGTCKTIKEFQSIEEVGDGKSFKELKGPDFVSRLKGYLNVLGPNPRNIGGIDDPSDVGYPIRRAIMLRVHAERFGSNRLDIDPGLLNAMLKIDEYTHGARSIQTIVNQITGRGKRGLLRSNIPPREQLGLHVNYDQFMKLVQEGAELHMEATKFKAKAKELGPQIHDFYLELAEKEGWKPHYGMKWDAPPPNNLPDHIKDDNFAAARRLPDVMSLAGLIVIEAQKGPGSNPDQVLEILKDNIECLAEAEHDGWMDTKLGKGWKWKEIRNDDEGEHPTLIPFKDLRPVDQGKDRDAVQNYLEIASLADFVIQLEEVIDAQYLPKTPGDTPAGEQLK
ncbi:MAG: hypothetical protein DRR04_13795, partial [Gammaproteobacteria bacterium]